MINKEECKRCEEIETLVESHMEQKHPKGIGMFVAQVLTDMNIEEISDDE